MRGPLVIEIDVIGVGGNGENVNAELGRQQCRRAVFIDHGLDTLYTSVGTDYWDAATSARNHQHSVVHQIANHFQLYDLDGLGGRHNAAIAASGILDDLPSQLTPALLGIGTRIKRADRFGRVLHGRIVLGDDDLRDQAHHRHLQAGGCEFVGQCLGQHVADLALRGSTADIQRVAGDLAGSAFRSEQRCTHLRPVAVSHDQAIVAADEADDGGGGATGIG